MTPTQQKIRDWRLDPDLFVREAFRVEPDRWQTKALRAFASQDTDKQRIAMKACVGPGKSAVLAWMGWNFLACYGEPGHHPKGAAVAMTRDNLRDNLWPEFSKWQQYNTFLLESFEWTKERIYAKDHPETWFISARSYSKDADADAQGRTLSGLHSKYVLGLLDESGEIPVPVLKAGEQMLSRCDFGKLVQAGNPSSLEGVLYHCCQKQRARWFVVTITGDPEDPDRSPRIDIEWAKDQIEQYGRDDPWIKYSILGEFPDSSINSLLSLDEVEQAMARHLRQDEYSFAQKRIGVDVAGEGDDRTVLFPRQGLAAFKPTILRGVDGPSISARVAAAKAKWNSELEFIDSTGGYGSSTIDSMRMAGLSPNPVNFASHAIAKETYFNRRAEMWWEMAQWVKRGGALPKSGELLTELTTPTYTHKNGRLLIEPKDKIKDRIGKSPDIADALALTFALPEMPTEQGIPAMWRQIQNRKDHDFDPFREMNDDV